MQNEPLRFAFFGSSQFSIYILEELEKVGMLPSVVVTTPPRPFGRKMIVTPTPVSVWASSRAIPVISPEKLDNLFIIEFKHHSPLVSIVASYGKIIPAEILNIPRYKTLNVHPSVLPLYRGATPIQSAMLDDVKNTGVTIIELDELMDHGPIIAMQKVEFGEWPMYEETEEILGRAGGKLLSDTLPLWINGEIVPENQDHNKATFTRKIKKEDGEISLSDAEIVSGKIEGKKGREIFLKSKAYSKWPSVFFIVNSKRVKIVETEWLENACHIKTVIPEGKSAMPYADASYFLNSK